MNRLVGRPAGLFGEIEMNGSGLVDDQPAAIRAGGLSG
jgi:hypothetical protein